MTENTTWPGWRQVRKLGSGSFGTVYEICREDDPSYRAALKVITIPQDESELNNAYGEGMDDNTVSSYFEGMVDDITREITVMDQFKGLTNIVSYEAHKVIQHKNDIGWDILIRMELLTPLLTFERERGYGLTEEETIKLGIDICQALILCEKSNIIHRDIKPENIFVNRFGDFVLGDFGIARQMEKSMGSMSVKGTYNYMAPEVYNGQHYGKTADIYSLGMVLYRCLNNRRGPFLPPAPQAISYKDRQEATRRRMSGDSLPAPVEGSDALKIIVLKATQYKAEQRYLKANELQSALRSVDHSKTNNNIEIFSGNEEINLTLNGINDKPQPKNNEIKDVDGKIIYNDTTNNETVKDGNDGLYKVESDTYLKKNNDDSFSNEDIEKTAYSKIGYTEETNYNTTQIEISDNPNKEKSHSDNSLKRKGMMWGCISLVAIVVCISVYMSTNTSNESISESSTLVSEADISKGFDITNNSSKESNNLIELDSEMSFSNTSESSNVIIGDKLTKEEEHMLLNAYYVLTNNVSINGVDMFTSPSDSEIDALEKYYADTLGERFESSSYNGYKRIDIHGTLMHISYKDDYVNFVFKNGMEQLIDTMQKLLPENYPIIPGEEEEKLLNILGLSKEYIIAVSQRENPKRVVKIDENTEVELFVYDEDSTYYSLSLTKYTDGYTDDNNYVGISKDIIIHIDREMNRISYLSFTSNRITY